MHAYFQSCDFRQARASFTTLIFLGSSERGQPMRSEGLRGVWPMAAERLLCAGVTAGCPRPMEIMKVWRLMFVNEPMATRLPRGEWPRLTSARPGPGSAARVRDAAWKGGSSASPRLPRTGSDRVREKAAAEYPRLSSVSALTWLEERERCYRKYGLEHFLIVKGLWRGGSLAGALSR